MDTRDFDSLATHDLSGDATCIRNQIPSYDAFIDGIGVLIESQFNQNNTLTGLDNKRKKNSKSKNILVKSVNYGFEFSNIKVSPVTYKDKNNACKPNYPEYCKKNKKTYALLLTGSIKFFQSAIRADGTKTEEETETYKNVSFGFVPCMVGSQYCHISKLGPDQRKAIKEAPYDKGGYFIIDGLEKNILSTKNVNKNMPQYYVKNRKGIAVESSIMSQHGDNYEASYYFKIHLMQNDALIFVISLKRNLTLYFPYFVLYYIFNIYSDKQIFDTIMPKYNSKDDRDNEMCSLINKSMMFKYGKQKKGLYKENYFHLYYDENGDQIKDPTELLINLSKIIDILDTSYITQRYNADKANNEDKKFIIKKLYKIFDTMVFPHIGIDENSRVKKLKYLGSLIYKTYSVKMGDTQSDRNSFSNMYIATTGQVLATSFKTIFNLTIVTNIIKELVKQYENGLYPLKMVEIAKTTIKTSQLTDGLCKAIKAGKKDKININKNPTTNRVFSVSNDLYNPITILHAKRCITSASNIGGKSNDAIILSRTPHPTYMGCTCMLFSVEGERAGQTLAIAGLTNFTSTIYSDSLKEQIMKNEDPQFKIESYDRIYSDEGKTYSQVILNGDPIGSHYNTLLLYRHLIEQRRHGIIDRNCSINYKPLNDGELNISTQKGRIIRPFIIVYNNFDEFMKGDSSSSKNIKFDQWITFEKKHSEMLKRKEIDLNYLIENRIIEYISPIEYTGIFVADSLETLVANRHDPRFRYTHVDIPLANFSISILTAVFANHAAANRTVYQGNQRRQTLAIPAFNYGDSFPKKLYLAHNLYHPLVDTVVDKILKSGGASVITAIMSYGANQEDSIAINESLSERNKYSINYIVTHSAELEARQSFRNPEIGKTQNIRGKSYSHMVRGTPIIGSVIRHGYPIIGIVEIDAKDSNIERDRSLIYKKYVPVVVDDVMEYQNGKGYRIMSVKVHNIRSLESGDKMSATTGGKAIISKIEYNEKMPISENGLCPDIIVNPHAFPSRYLPNQFMVAVLSKYCAAMGYKGDGTIFSNFDNVKLEKKMAEIGIDISGEERFYNNTTGEFITSKIAIFPTLYQRLHKMIDDSSTVVQKPIVDIRTQQRQKGINNDGATRIGEMEKETAIAAGAINSLRQKFFKDSDGKVVYICNTCYQFAVVNRKRNIYNCRTCNNTTFSEMKSCFGTFNFLSYLRIIGIGTEVRPSIPEFPVNDID